MNLVFDQKVSARRHHRFSRRPGHRGIALSQCAEHLHFYSTTMFVYCWMGLFVAVDISSAGGTGVAQQPRARARWADIKKSVDMIKMMKGKESAQVGKVRERAHILSFVPCCSDLFQTSCSQWHSLIDDLKDMQ